jgi:hypothetical protein
VEEEFMFKERSWERPEFGEVESAQAGVRKWLLLYTLTVKSGSRTMIPPTFRLGITFLRNSSGYTPPPV